MVDAHTSEGDETDAADVDGLLQEVAELRAENDRMRSLLGVGTRDEAVFPWELTLFEQMFIRVLPRKR
jgi:cytochrome c-type biogenesis protein CcmH/NrfG